MDDTTLVILGRQEKLSLGELERLFGANAVSLIAPHVAHVALPASDVVAAQPASAIKIAAFHAVVPGHDWQSVSRRIAKKLARTMADAETSGDKITFGLSLYAFASSVPEVERSGLIIKKQLKALTGNAVRYVANKDLALGSAHIIHNHLTQGDTGYEWLFIASNDGTTMIGRTQHVQDIDGYSLRDFDRPRRDARNGMLPPKLAGIMLSLAGVPRAGTVLDPFCGTGVVLMEAALRGYRGIGSDLNPKMIEHTDTNMVWLNEQLKADYQWQALQADATTFEWRSTITDGWIDAVVGEGFLGQPLTVLPQREKLEGIVHEANTIMKGFLANIAPQLAAGTPLCIAAPAWAIGQGQFKHLPVVHDLETLGFERVQLSHATDADLIYHRDGQVVARELLVLKKK